MDASICCTGMGETGIYGMSYYIYMRLEKIIVSILIFVRPFKRIRNWLVVNIILRSVVDVIIGSEITTKGKIMH
jgi:hypothetical protein